MMKKLIYVLIITFYFCNISKASQESCNRVTVLEKAKLVLENLVSLEADLLKALKGDFSSNLSATEIFGHNFDLESTNARISFLKNEIKRGVSLENKSILKCLVEIGEPKLKEKIIRSFKSVNNLKIEIINNNSGTNDWIRKGKVSREELPEIKKKITKENKDTELEKSILVDKLVSAKIEASKRENDYLNELIKIKIHLLETKLLLNQSLEERIKFFETKTKELNKLSAKSTVEDLKNLKVNYNKVEAIWLILARDESVIDFFGNQTPELPLVPNNSYKNNIEIDKVWLEVKALKKNIIKSYRESKTQEIKLINQLRLSTDVVRGIYFNRFGKVESAKRLLLEGKISILKDEVISIPKRIVSYLYPYFLYVKEKMSLGVEGYRSIIFKIFEVFGVFLLLTLIIVLLDRILLSINKLFEKLVQRNKKSFLIKQFYVLWERINEAIRPLSLVVLLVLVRDVAAFESFTLLNELVVIVLISKVLQVLITSFLGSVTKVDSGSYSEFKIKSSSTSIKVRNIYLFYSLSLISLEVTVGRVFIYSIVNILVLVYSLYWFLEECSKWEKEFTKYSEKMFSGVVVGKFIEVLNFTPRKARSPLLFLFIVILVTVDFFITLTKNFEVSKKISANLFKKQIERVEAEDGADEKISKQYKEFFSLKSLDLENGYVRNLHGLEDKVCIEVEEWYDDKSEEHSLVIYGDKGIGKTTLVKQVLVELQEKLDLDVEYVKMPSKTISVKELNEFFESVLGTSNLYDYDTSLTRKKVIVIDECQNVFLSQTEGFDAYHSLVNIINLNTRNVFWITSFNKYSWLYLSKAFGNRQFFRNVFEVRGWSDSKVKELIMRRHSKTEYKLSYDLLISATKSEDEIDRYASVESKFFKLLWELSRGNPRAALSLWITALSKKNSSTFNVNIPKEVDVGNTESISDDVMFVVSHILKHENLTSFEVVSTTNLPNGLVRNALKLAMEKQFLYRDERSRYMLNISTQYGLMKLLKIKNFIYGS